MMQKFKKYSSNSACIDTDYKDATGTDQRNSLYFTINKGDDPHIVLAIEEEDQEKATFILYPEALQELVNWLRNEGLIA